MANNRRATAYFANDLQTLDELRLSCERDESQLNAIIVALITGKIENPNVGNDAPATIAVYEFLPTPRPPGTRPGDLVFVPVGPGVNPTTVIQQQDQAGNRHLFDGTAQIKNNVGVVMIFKPKQ